MRVSNSILFAVAGLLMTGSGLQANEPILNVTAPSGILYVSNFPYSAPITFSIYHGPSTTSSSTTNELKNINVLDVSVNGQSLFASPLGNPFGTDNACSSQMSLPQVSNCAVSDSNNATVTVPWSIPGPGSYVIVVSVKHQGDTGSDTDTVQVQILTASYPAPPSLANSFINGYRDLKSVAPKVRGCVLNEIAEQHAKYDAYGPKGGPYDEIKVQTDVYRFWTGTCGAAWPNTVPIP